VHRGDLQAVRSSVMEGLRAPRRADPGSCRSPGSLRLPHRQCPISAPMVRPMTDHSAAKAMWEERYRAADYAYGTEPNGFLRDNVDTLPVGEALCLAEGEGRNAVFLASTGRRVSSVDLAEAGVEKTLRLAAAQGVVVDAVVGDLASFDLGVDRWDGIVSIFAHVPSSLRVDLHRRVVTALRPGGVFLLEAYTPDQVGRGTGGPPSPDMMMTLAELRQELQPLELLHAGELEREVIEGSHHSGVGSVVQVIARKSV
jgi:SAM-dependent methyltransferase